MKEKFFPKHDEPKEISHKDQKESAKVAHEEHKLIEVKQKELEERLMRLQAEFENFRKRSIKENEMVRETASSDLLAKLLPVVDEFGIAIEHIGKSHNPCKEQDQKQKQIHDGMNMIYKKMMDIFSKEGLEEMKCLGQNFDPYKHDALRHAPGEDGKVIEVIQKGYMLRGKILRHAKVIVGNGEKIEK